MGEKLTRVFAPLSTVLVTLTGILTLSLQPTDDRIPRELGIIMIITLLSFLQILLFQLLINTGVGFYDLFLVKCIRVILRQNCTIVSYIRHQVLLIKFMVLMNRTNTVSKLLRNGDCSICVS